MSPIVLSILCLFYVLMTYLFVEISQIGTMSVLVLGVVLALAIINMKIVLGLLPLLFAVSPEIIVGNIPLVLEDFVIPVLLLVLLLRIILLKEEIYWSPLFLPIGIILFINLTTTLWGLFSGYLNPFTTFFRNLKIIEYVATFFLVTNGIKNQKDAVHLSWCLLLGGLAGGIYGTAQYLINANEPVTGPAGEDYNTFAGFLLFNIALALSIFSKVNHPKEKWLSGAASLFLIFPFIFTFSRTSYIAFILMLLYIGFFHTRFAFAILGCVVLGYFTLFPSALAERISTIWDITGSITQIPPALLARLEGWRFIYDFLIVKNPLFGGGVGRVQLVVDSEFIKIFAETGFLGLLAFFWFIASIIKTAKEANLCLLKNDNVPKVLTALPIASGAIILAFLVHSIGSTTFTTIRTMEPFWFFIGVLAVLMKVYPKKWGDGKNVWSF